MERKNTNYSILVIGLGSMGKRRIRCLQTLGFKNIYGFDTRADRRREAEELYKIQIAEDLEFLLKNKKINTFIISVPPDKHYEYMKMAVDLKIPFFVEASVVDDGLNEIISATELNNIKAAPSSTLYFHPAIKKIFEIVKHNELGKITNFVYHSGQYLPDWHTYEKVSDYYVSKKETGGAREIVPFELTWITKLLGFPRNVSGIVKKTITIEGSETIDDTYNALLNYDDFIVNIVIDVVSRHATRKLLINGSKKQLRWNWDDNNIKIFYPETNQWESIEYQVTSAKNGYNKNITEQMYIDELNNFFDDLDGKAEFFNTLEYDHKVLKLLYAIEESSQSNSFQLIK